MRGIAHSLIQGMGFFHYACDSLLECTRSFFVMERHLNNQDNFPVVTQLDIPASLTRAYAHWNAGQAVQAEQLCRYVLAALPYQSDALHLLGIMAHAYGQLDVAIAHLHQACLAPGAPAPYFSNLAEMCRQKGLLAEAELAAQQAVALDPQLIDAWNNLGIILQESGKLESSLDCLLKVVALRPDAADAHNNLANTYKQLGRLAQAQTHYQQAIGLNPDYAEAHSNLSFLLSGQGQFDEAVAVARRAIEINPHLMDAYLNLAEAETSRMRNSEALRWLEALHAFAPHHPGGLAARAKILKKFDRIEEGLTCALEAVTLAPEFAGAHNAYGQMLQAAGRHEEALAAFDRAAALPGSITEEALIARASLFLEIGKKKDAAAAFDKALAAFPNSIRALTARADAKTFRTGDADIAVMEAGLSQREEASLADRMTIHFALGKAYLDTGDSDRAFFHMHNANGLKRATFSYDAAATHRWMATIAATFKQQSQGGSAAVAAASSLPVFIIGMPRSGTTLLEQVLASHPQVHGAGELSALRLALDAAGVFPDAVGQWTSEEMARIGKYYLDCIEPLAKGKDRLIDKMPGNFLYAGVIPMILPGARIIHCRRDPVDTCLSCYSKLFEGQQLFSYALEELGRFYRDYESLMSHWRQILPAESFIEVDYEAVVDDLEGQAKRLIDFLDLPWDEACLNFHKTDRIVRTASVNQVRQPIYTTSKGRWRAHAAQLGPLLAALEIDPQ